MIPVNVNLMAANKSPITVEGAACVRLEGVASDGSEQSCSTMVYISRQAQGFYLSLENMMELGIVPRDFPSIKPSSSIDQVGHTTSTIDVRCHQGEELLLSYSRICSRDAQRVTVNACLRTMAR